MSFAESLWDNFDLVHRYSMERKKCAEDFVQLLRERILNDTNSARNVERIGKHPYFSSSNGTLIDGLIGMKNEFMSKGQQTNQFAQSVTNEIIEPLRNLLRDQSLVIKKISVEGSKLQKERNTLQEKFNRAKEKYFKACQDCEQATIDLEQSMATDSQNKSEKRLVQCKKEMESSLKAYKAAIFEFNSNQLRYKEMMPRIMEIYQYQEQQRTQIIKDSLQKIIEYEEQLLQLQQNSIKEMRETASRISLDEDIGAFIQNYGSSTNTLQSIEFVQYEGTHPAFQPNSAPVYQQDLQGQLPLVNTAPPSSGIPQTSTRVIMESLLDKLWKKNVLEGHDSEYLVNLIQEESARHSWSSWFNMQKFKGETELNAQLYSSVSLLMHYMLQQCDVNQDAANLQYCLVILTSFYKVVEGRQEVLLKASQGSGVNQNVQVWEKVMINILEQALKENSESERLHVTSARIVLLFAQAMLWFQVSQEQVIEFVQKYFDVYGIESEGNILEKLEKESFIDCSQELGPILEKYCEFQVRHSIVSDESLELGYNPDLRRSSGADLQEELKEAENNPEQSQKSEPPQESEESQTQPEPQQKQLINEASENQENPELAPVPPEVPEDEFNPKQDEDSQQNQQNYKQL